MRHHYTREQIDALVLVAGGTDKARRVLDALGAVSGAWYLQTADEVAYAHHLLTQRMPRAEVKDRLVQRFGLGVRSAWRRISEALKTPLCHNQKL